MYERQTGRIDSPPLAVVLLIGFMSFVEIFKITIRSRTEEGQAVQVRIVKLLEKLDYPPRDVFGVRLALEEASRTSV